MIENEPPAAEPEAAAAEDAGVVVDGPRRLSESLIWKLQRAFYERAGPQAWKPHGVPFYVTNNAFIARAYARLVLGALRDLRAAGAIDPSQPLYLIELAAGTGRFAHLFLRALEEARQELPEAVPEGLLYVLTDFAPRNVEAWPSHPRLAPLAEQGRLDFARFDLERDDEITLVRSGARLARGAVANPVLALANYAFDTTVHDAFQVRSGRLHELRVSAVSTQEEPSLDDPDVLSRLSLRYEEGAVPPDYYDDPVAGRVLAAYEGLADTTLLMPVAALRCVRALRGWSDGRLLLVCGDKAFSDEAELVGRVPISALQLHGGSFSLPVNLHALEAYFREVGGEALQSSRRDYHFKVALFASGLGPLPETRLAFRDGVDRFGPGEYYHLSYTLSREHRQPSFDVLLGLLRLGDWDAELVSAWREGITKRVRETKAYHREELRRGLRRALENYFPLHRNVPLDFAWIAMSIDAPEDAIEYAQESLRLFGESALPLAVKGLAHASLRQMDQALRCADMALALQPDNVAARQLKDKLTALRRR